MPLEQDAALVENKTRVNGYQWGGSSRAPQESPPEPTPEEQYQALQEYRFSLGNPVEKPEAVISIEGHILATAGNIFTLVGQAKTGKSGVLSAIIAGTLALKGDTGIDLLGFTVKRNIEGKAVIHIDGEQSIYDYHRGVEKAFQRASRTTQPDWFHSYSFLLFDVPQRIAKLKLLCNELSKSHGGIYMIILDGGAEFVEDTNDQKESNQVVRLFHSLAVEHSCPLVNVLHFNPGSEKGRGHFGSQLERKSETVISVTKTDDEISTVEGKLLRHCGKIPNLQFIYDEEKGYHVYHGTKIKEGKSEAKAKKLKELAEVIFSDGEKLFNRTDLGTQIMNTTGLKLRQAENYIKDMVEMEIIKHSEGDKKFMLIGGSKAPPF